MITITPNKNQLELTIDQDKLSQNFNILELTTFLYVYDQNQTSDNINFLPYEEYVNDVTEGKRSTYQPTKDYVNKLFGITIAVLIFAFFWAFNRSDIFSIQSVVSILGAYAIGKEAWSDIDGFLSTLTKTFAIRWLPQNYFYKRENFGTIQRFWDYARKQRNKRDMLLASKFDFIKQNNSKTVELLFTKKDILSKFDNPLFLKINSASKDNNMLGFKIALSRKIFSIQFTEEYFQALSNNEIGTMDRKKWIKDKAFVRKTISIGRLKFYLRSSLVDRILVRMS